MILVWILDQDKPKLISKLILKRILTIENTHNISIFPNLDVDLMPAHLPPPVSLPLQVTSLTFSEPKRLGDGGGCTINFYRNCCNK